MSSRALTDDRATRKQLEGQFFECGSDTLPDIPTLTMPRPCNYVDMAEINVRDRFAYTYTNKGTRIALTRVLHYT